MKTKLLNQNIKEKNITSVARHANGLLKRIQNNSLSEKVHKVQILTTPGCGGCETVKKMLDGMKVKYEIIDVIKNPEILKKYPIMAAPGIVIDGKLKFVGVPKEKELREELK